MSYDSLPDADHIQKFAERMRTQWAKQDKLDTKFLDSEQLRNLITVATSKSISTKEVLPLRSGIRDQLLDEDGAMLTVTPFAHVNPLSDEKKEKEHVSELLEPFIAAALKLSQKTGRVFLRKPRTMCSPGR